MIVDYGSVCSGIEAASVAWERYGWQPSWFAEIEPFPCKVLKHHWPHVSNLGDMTAIAGKVRSGEVKAPVILVGGTPCQAFSLAGRRQGLADARGQLTLAYVDLLDAIDEKRISMGNPECIAVWENVPGVLTSADNAFGCFLAALAGDDEPVEPGPQPQQGRSSSHWTWDKNTNQHRPKWSDAGYVVGPSRTVAWIVKDAQYFGLAQRRRRVFVVASARDGFDPGEILFEFNGVRRDSAPSREAGQTVAPTIRAGAANGGPSHGARSGDSKDEMIVPVSTEGLFYGGGNCSGPISVATALNANERYDFDSETFALAYSAFGDGYWCDGLGPLRARTQDSHENLAVAFGGDLARTLTARHDSSPCVDRGMDVVAISFNHNALADQLPSIKSDTTVTASLTCSQGSAVAYLTAGVDYENNGHTSEEPTGLLLKGSPTGGGRPLPAISLSNMKVRRLMPVECERLQGFPDGHTDVPDGKKSASDGPRYKSLGNSMATNCMGWLGYRLNQWFLRQTDNDFADILG